METAPSNNNIKFFFKIIKYISIACGFNVEKFDYKNLSFTAYDVGG